MIAGLAAGAFVMLGGQGDEKTDSGKTGNTQNIETTGVPEKGNAEDPAATVFFASDYGENAGWDRPSTTLSGILKAACSDGKTPQEIVLLGDYNSVVGKNNYELDPENSIEEIRETAQAECSGLTSSDFIFVQGNVDKWSSSLSGSGLHEFEDYLVYVLNTENDFPWSQGKTEESRIIVEKAADRMKECFDELIADGEKRPVFIASHMPLHFTARTASKTGDNLYSSIIFDTVNEAGRSLDIVYLYGHNCAKGWDCYLGGSSVFKPAGETLLVPDCSKSDVRTEEFTEETLQFTYLNSGYIGYYMNCSQDDLENGLLNNYSAADETLTGTICEIYPGKLVLTRYDVNGVHPIGWDGEADPYDNYIDRNMIDSKYYSHKVDSPQVVNRK